MGEGEEVKIREDSNIHIQERGEIFIFCRPKVNKDAVHSEEDVQRLYLVLRPESYAGDRHVELKQSTNEDEGGNRIGGRGAEEVKVRKEGMLMRLIVMGRKSLTGPVGPGPKSRPHWGFVELVTADIEALKRALQAEEYETSTRGHRRKPPAFAIGEGVYRLLNHTSSTASSTTTAHTHLVYKLQLPTRTHHHRLLNVDPEASFLLQVKNPESTTARFKGIQSKRKATFPASLQGRFGKRRYIPTDPPDFLNYEGCELLLIPASRDIKEELGLELKTELDLVRDRHQRESSSSDVSDDDEESLAVKCSDFVHTFGEDSGISSAPLFQGA